MRAHVQHLDFFLFQFDVAIDLAVSEDVALGEELTISIQCAEGLFK